MPEPKGCLGMFSLVLIEPLLNIHIFKINSANPDFLVLGISFLLGLHHVGGMILSPRGGGGTLIFSYISRLGPFLGVQNLEIQYVRGFSEK